MLKCDADTAVLLLGSGALPGTQAGRPQVIHEADLDARTCVSW
jgi:hypothetical protein